MNPAPTARAGKAVAGEGKRRKPYNSIMDYFRKCLPYIRDSMAEKVKMPVTKEDIKYTGRVHIKVKTRNLNLRQWIRSH